LIFVYIDINLALFYLQAFIVKIQAHVLVSRVHQLPLVWRIQMARTPVSVMMIIMGLVASKSNPVSANHVSTTALASAMAINTHATVVLT
jgi:hypothetical protein